MTRPRAGTSFRSRVRKVFEGPEVPGAIRVLVLPGDLLIFVGYPTVRSGYYRMIVADGPRAGHQVDLKREELKELSPLEQLALQAPKDS